MLQRPNSKFCKTLKKYRSLSVQTGLSGSNDLRVGRKMANFQLFFSAWSGSGIISTLVLIHHRDESQNPVKKIKLNTIISF